MNAQSLEAQVGKIFEADDGHKIIVIAYDAITDNAIVYDYVLQEERVLTRHAWEDYMVNPWSDVVSAEKQMIADMSGRVSMQLWQAFVEGCTVEDGKSQAFHVIEKLVDGVPTQERYAYQVCKIAEMHNRIGMSAIETFARNAGQMFKNTLDLHGVNHIVWRKYPEIDLFHDPLRGTRNLVAYARLAAFSNGDCVNIDGQMKEAA
jgi:hypothetical protein